MLNVSKWYICKDSMVTIDGIKHCTVETYVRRWWFYNKVENFTTLDFWLAFLPNCSFKGYLCYKTIFCSEVAFDV